MQALVLALMPLKMFPETFRYSNGIIVYFYYYLVGDSFNSMHHTHVHVSHQKILKKGITLHVFIMSFQWCCGFTGQLLQYTGVCTKYCTCNTCMNLKVFFVNNGDLFFLFASDHVSKTLCLITLRYRLIKKRTTSKTQYSIYFCNFYHQYHPMTLVCWVPPPPKKTIGPP